MSEQKENPEALKKQDAAIKQLQALFGKLDKDAATAKSSGVQLGKSLDIEKDD